MKVEYVFAVIILGVILSIIAGYFLFWGTICYIVVHFLGKWW